MPIHTLTKIKTDFEALPEKFEQENAIEQATNQIKRSFCVIAYMGAERKKQNIDTTNTHIHTLFRKIISVNQVNSWFKIFFTTKEDSQMKHSFKSLFIGILDDYTLERKVSVDFLSRLT